MNEDLRKTILKAVEGVADFVDIHDYLEGSETVEDVIAGLRESLIDVEISSWQVCVNNDIEALIKVLEKLL